MLLICKFTYRNRLPKSILLLCFCSFLLSVLWIWLIAKILVELLESLGVIFNIEQNYLGLTLLAWGNSIPGIY